MSTKAIQLRSKTAAAVKIGGLSFKGDLAAAELLTGTPTAVIRPDDGSLVVDQLARNTVTLTIRVGDEPDPQKDEVCAANEAVTFLVTGGRKGKIYDIEVQCPGTVSALHAVVCRLEVT